MEQNPFGKKKYNMNLTTPEDHKRIIKEAIAAEGMKGTILGMHDYRSNLREYNFVLKRKGPSELLKEIAANPLKTFSDYFREVDGNNHNLRTKIEQDMALYPGIVSEFNELVTGFNNSKTEEEAVSYFHKLERFFDSEN